MNLVEAIRNSQILNADNEIILEEAVANKSSKTIRLSIVLSYAISKAKYDELTQFINEQFAKIKYCPTTIIGYQDDSLSNEDYLEYLKCIIDDLSKTSARYQTLNPNDCIIDGNNITFKVAYDALGIKDLCNPVKKAFEAYGLDVEISIFEDETKSVQAQIDALDKEIQENLDRQKEEALKASRFNKAIAEEGKKNYAQRNMPTTLSKISEIPTNAIGIAEYKNTNGPAIFLLNAYVFGIEVRSLNKSKTKLAQIKVTDETDSIVVKKWLRTEAEQELYETDIVEGTELRIIGEADYDSYAKDVVLNASKIEIIGKHKEEEVVDNAPVKRVELHCHTKMTTLDGLTDAADYIKLVSKWGWNSMAFTDLAGVYEFSDVDHVLDKFPDFKPIFGVELPFVDDDDYFITFDERDIDLKNATYVVYDIETTGFSQAHDRIIEIGAHKVKQGMIIDQFEVFVNPERHIPARISELTSITDEMVESAETIEQVLPKFMEFCEGSILVAHNARFDVGMIYANIERLGLDYPVLPVIDTLNLFRAGYYDEVKTFNLKSLSKYFKVKQEQHHRATDDTRVTALCFLQMLNDLYQKGITNYKDINSLINKDEHWKHVIPYHVNFLALNPVGYKNLFKLTSDALTKHLAKEAKALKSVVETFREGILVGSGCDNGIVFETALNRSEEELREKVKYFDYIEVQPPLAYSHLFKTLPDGEETIKDVLRQIIRVAQEEGKLVVATSNCHYDRPNLKHYRNILIRSKQVGGGMHRLEDYLKHYGQESAPSAHLRTTEEMLNEFSFLERDLAYEIVVENTNKIADMVEKFPPFKKGKDAMYAPRDDEFKNSILHVDSIVSEVRRIVKENEVAYYGENPHPIVRARIDRELNSIISNGYASVYYMSHLLVKKSLSDGYLVGSRGSVGSSLVATMMDITEINPLAPHYRCKKCKFHSFKMSEEDIKNYGLSDIEAPLQPLLQAVDTGYDLPDAICPVCGEPLKKDGHDIPFETFLGFNGDKVPDIDLNFSGDNQAEIHRYICEVFGPENAFRGGTVGTIADNTAYGYVKGYCEDNNITLRSCEMERLATYLVGIKRSTGQHPGGIVVVPHYVDIYDVTPVQYPADDNTAPIRTTHFDYHSFEDNLLKLDILGHDDPTLIRYLMDYVHLHQEKFPFDNPQDIPIDDPKIYKLFNSTDVIGVTEEQIDSKIASFAVPEFGTNFVRGMLVETVPKTFAELVKISGLSHGTNVWATNAQELVNGRTEFGQLPFSKLIGCRDDIMVDLIHMGLEPIKAFKTMEFVRKGKLHKKGGQDAWAPMKEDMQKANVPDWYIWSCERIEYMFPKAHATAYVMMAMRIAWFKVNSPALFYSAWFSKRAKGHDVNAYVGGPIAIKAKIEELKTMEASGKNDDLKTALQVALEMTSRGLKFLPLDIMKSDSEIFVVEDDNSIRIPFSAVDGLGASAAEDIVQKRNEKVFTSKKDVLKRTKLNNTLFEKFNLMRAFGDLPDEDPEEEMGIFAFA